MDIDPAGRRLLSEPNIGNLGFLEPEPVPWHGQPVSAAVTRPPLAAIWLVPYRD